MKNKWATESLKLNSACPHGYNSHWYDSSLHPLSQAIPLSPSFPHCIFTVTIQKMILNINVAIKSTGEPNRPTLQCWNVSLRIFRIQAGNERIVTRSGTSSNVPTWRTQVDSASIICIIAWKTQKDLVKILVSCQMRTMFFQKKHNHIHDTIHNKLYLFRPKSKSHCLRGHYNLYSEWHHLSLDPRFGWGKICHTATHTIKLWCTNCTIAP